MENNCAYCVAAHSTIALRVGVQALRTGKPLPDNELEAVRRPTRSIVAGRGWVDDEEIDVFRSLAAVSPPTGRRPSSCSVAAPARTALHSTEPDTTGWSFRTIRFPLLDAQLLFGVCSKLTDLTRTAFRSRLLLRHHDLCSELQDPEELTSIGVLLTRGTDGLRERDTTVMAITGDPELSDVELTTHRDLWEPRPQAG